MQINAVERPQIWPQWGAEASDLRDICILWLDCSSVKWEPGRLWRRVIIYILAKLAENQHKKWHFTSYTCSCLHWYPHSAISAWGWVPIPLRAPPWWLTAGGEMPGWAREGRELRARDPSCQRQKFCWWIWVCLWAEVGQDPPLIITRADVNPQTATAVVAIKSSKTRFILCTKDISACSSNAGLRLTCLWESSPPCPFVGMRWTQRHPF